MTNVHISISESLARYRSISKQELLNVSRPRELIFFPPPRSTWSNLF